MFRLLRIGRMLLVCILLAASSQLYAKRDGQAALEPIRVQLKWLHQFQFAGYYAALEKGFYAEHGLEVELLEGRPELDPAEVVLAGGAQYGVGTPEILLDYAGGEPLVALGVIFQHSPYVFLATFDSGISDIGQLTGKRIMMETQAAELYAYLTRERIPLSSLTILPHSFNADGLMDGSVDAMSAYATDEEFALNEQAVPYSAFSPRSGGVDFYGDLFFTTQSEIEKHPDRVRAFYEATIEGWQYAMQHPEEIVDLILEKYPTQKSRDALLFEADKMSQLMHPEIIPVGYMYKGRWQHIAETYQELGMLKTIPKLDPFLYDPNPPPNYTWALWTSGITLAVALVAFGILLPVWRLNGRLRREIEHRRRTEEKLKVAKLAAERANQIKAQFLASVTHDLRTPLNAIIGLSEIMLHDEREDEEREHLESIHKAGESLLRMVDELLDLNRIESGRIGLRDDPFILDDVLDEVANLLRVPAQRKSLELTVRLESAECASLRGDPERLRQILFNLGGNAVKFTHHGFVRISASKDSEGWLCLSIEDSGPGIPEEIREQLFDPFVRSKDAHETEGTGLGLSIVRRVAEAMGGTAAVGDKAHGEGALFLVRLPIIDPAPNEKALELSTCLDGLPIAVRLKSKERMAAAMVNLACLGARPSLFDASHISEYTLVLLDPAYATPDMTERLDQAGCPRLILTPRRSLMTRRTLAHLVRSKLSMGPVPGMDPH
ncbi:ABC transporter substrate-binding protein [Ruficoccus sp. ZRK36]|uniref:ABC transporter substrate-binding protein n=1 Tax=Ruficoccus sp. ZRK36 TaxID=2866311 RepID=UPI001C73615E|nr:ABC transporter substrate-binding protein [Ruficoccus sp. ZRK36]QYY35220.1 ABC transporter substrate-binding protein [Ruficoccus sp. ZRK36]